MTTHQPPPHHHQGDAQFAELDGDLHVMTPEEQRRKRRRAGLCPSCGEVRTHRRGLLKTMLMPDTVDGLVYKGICLRCNSLDAAKLQLCEPIGCPADDNSQRRGTIHCRQSTIDSSMESHPSLLNGSNLTNALNGSHLTNDNNASNATNDNCNAVGNSNNPQHSGLDGSDDIDGERRQNNGRRGMGLTEMVAARAKSFRKKGFSLRPSIDLGVARTAAAEQAAGCAGAEGTAKSGNESAKPNTEKSSEEDGDVGARQTVQCGEDLANMISRLNRKQSNERLDPPEERAYTDQAVNLGACSTQSSDGTERSTKGESRSKDDADDPGSLRPARPVATKRKVGEYRCRDSDGNYGFYSGTVNKDELPHGRGEMVYDDGSIAKGVWSNGLLKVKVASDRERYGPYLLPGYDIGDAGRREDMASHSSVEEIAEAVSRLHVGDCAFIRRSDGTWSYAVVKSRSDDYEDESITFQANEKGSTKTIKSKQWGGHVRTPARPDVLPGYSLGEPGREEDMMVACSSETEKCISRLRAGDAAFVRRSDGSFSYALVVDRSPDGDDLSISFRVNERGCTKVIPASQCGKHVRRIARSRAEDGLSDERARAIFRAMRASDEREKG